MLSLAAFRSISAPITKCDKVSVSRSISDSKQNTINTVPKISYSINKLLSKSIYGQVFLATQKPVNAQCVIKLSNLKMVRENDSSENPQEEVRILDFLSRNPHPNIISHVDQFVVQDHLYHVMEYFPGQDFFDFILTTKTGLPEIEARTIFKQLISAVKHLHKQDVVHLDISPENILINPNTYKIKIIDFGAALILPPQDTTLTGRRGKACYIAPEAYAGKKFHGKSADIYSCGTLLFVMLFAAPAYSSPTSTDDNFKIMMSQRYNATSFPYKKVSESVLSLLKMIITPENKRCSLSDIENHPWMK
jgi:serine/threonine protein kinase